MANELQEIIDNLTAMRAKLVEARRESVLGQHVPDVVKVQKDIEVIDRALLDEKGVDRHESPGS